MILKIERAPEGALSFRLALPRSKSYCFGPKPGTEQNHNRFVGRGSERHQFDKHVRGSTHAATCDRLPDMTRTRRAALRIAISSFVQDASGARKTSKDRLCSDRYSFSKCPMAIRSAVRAAQNRTRHCHDTGWSGRSRIEPISSRRTSAVTRIAVDGLARGSGSLVIE